MADTRINALSTATVSISDDFLPIDGTTAGTKKLSAYNPSFGGNATVGGTLTVSGGSMSVQGGFGSITSILDGTAGSYKLHLYRSGGVDRWYCGVQALAESGSNAGAPFGITALSDAGAQIDIPLQITRAAGGSIFLGRPVKAQDTTASTTTSSGALVVGNGTSGGLGVGGAIYAGGYVSTGNHARIGAQSSVVALSANNNVDGGLPAAWTGNYGVGVQYLGSSSNAFFIGDGSGGSTYFYTRTGSANTARLSIDNTNGNVTIGGTLQVGNAYVGGAPTATGYIVIKDSTGTSYKIPAQAL
jgi:hypothetical protein